MVGDSFARAQTKRPLPWASAYALPALATQDSIQVWFEYVRRLPVELNDTCLQKQVTSGCLSSCNKLVRQQDFLSNESHWSNHWSCLLFHEEFALQLIGTFFPRRGSGSAIRHTPMRNRYSAWESTQNKSFHYNSTVAAIVCHQASLAAPTKVHSGSPCWALCLASPGMWTHSGRSGTDGIDWTMAAHIKQMSALEFLHALDMSTALGADVGQLRTHGRNHNQERKRSS